MASLLPSNCQQCGFMFPSNAIGFAPNASVKRLSVRNATESCPRCGGRAKVIDGVFDIDDGIVSIINAPDLSHKQLALFINVLSKAHEANKTTSEIAAEAKRISPKLRKLVVRAGRKAKSPAKIAPWLIIAILLAKNSGCTANFDFTAEFTGDINQLANQVIEAIKSPE